MTLDEVTQYLHEHIPLSRHLGARLVHWDGRTARLSAPLEPNLNHVGTAFGGSMSALAILCGWTLLHLALEERGVPHQLVIQTSTMDFAEPVEGDFTATSSLPDAAQWERFLATLERHHRARIAVAGAVESAAGVGCSYQGRYVALRQPTGAIGPT
jgi:thioesterase domain-containing protein